MKVEVQEASINDKLIIRNMMELYNYDLSEYEDSNLNEHGLYEYKYIDNYWTEGNRHPFIVKVNDKLAGFVLAGKYGSVTSYPTDYSIAEFFILKKYRKNGVGKTVAFVVFNKFRGNWEVKQLKKNSISHSFWRKVIAQYTLNNFEEITNFTEIWEGPIQRFNNR
jgi:predicted acetyltransferase